MEAENEKIELQTHNGKNKPAMPRKHYELLSEFILNILQQQERVNLMELMELANNKFNHQFNGEVAWQLLWIKQDMEVRGMIEIAHQKSCAQTISLKKKVNPVGLTGKRLTIGHNIVVLDDHRGRSKKWTVNSI